VTACPRCGEDVDPRQEYCVECGMRLSGSGPVGRTTDPGQSWMLRTLFALIIALAGGAAAVAATGDRGASLEIVIATGGFATVPTSSTLPSPPQAGAGVIVDWPAGDDGWTIALASVPQTQGRRVAVERAREARETGLPSVGILDSSRYASLHPGYWVVFTGVYASEAEATSGLEPARKAARTATVRRVVP